MMKKSKTLFYPGLAVTGIKKNRRLYVPYILTCIGTVMMFYIVASLALSPIMGQIAGGKNMQLILGFGYWVIGIFSLVFLIYSNTFIIKRRKKEFGLYNILGMNKSNIAKIMLYETLIILAITLVGGITAGIVFSKFAELAMINLLREDIVYSFFVPLEAIWKSCAVFAAIYFIIFFISLRQIHTANPIELFHSESKGEKAPKANFVLALTGAVLLGIAYFIAVTVDDPISAMTLFFVAVILVIIGTYFLFIAGSVALCKILQKNKKYYFKPNHFVSVSSMLYRMKRNGAGLASICILCTMVLVIISSTFSLYTGSEDSLNAQHPGDINFQAIFLDYDCISEENIGRMHSEVNETVKNTDITVLNDYTAICFPAFLLEDGTLCSVNETTTAATDEGMCIVYVISLDDYNRTTGLEETLEDDEIIAYCGNRISLGDTMGIKGENTYRIKYQPETFISKNESMISLNNFLYLVVGDTKAFSKSCIDGTFFPEGTGETYYTWIYRFDTDLDDDGDIKLAENIQDGISYDEFNINSMYVSSKAAQKTDFYSTYGGLFFVGIILSAVFISAAVLIIYYKQITEGYEDAARFEIMKKVGMTEKDIKKSVSSQMLTVFFMPLAAGGVHLAFAFPMIKKLLSLFSLENTALLIGSAAVCFAVFCILYTGVYKITSRTYFHIVNGKADS